MPNPLGNPNIADAGKDTRFSKTRRPNNPGRKPSKLKKWIKDYELSKSDVNAVFTNFLFDKDIGEIEEIISNKKLRDKLPAAIAFQLQILVKQATKGDGRHLENVLYLLFGKPTQNLEVAATGTMNISNLSMEDRQKRLEALVTKLMEKQDGYVKAD